MEVPFERMKNWRCWNDAKSVFIAPDIRINLLGMVVVQNAKFQPKGSNDLVTYTGVIGTYPNIHLYHIDRWYSIATRLAGV